MIAVAGTPVTALPPDARPAFVVSDLHVPAAGGPVVASLQVVLDEAARRRARVFLLGDLFDSFVTPRQGKVGVWADVASRLLAASRAGVELVLLHGNRDFMLGSEFERASGARVVAGGVRCTLAGRDTLLLHGDELCENDLPYQRAKRWLRHPVTRWALRRLPLGAALRAGDRARARSMTVVASGDPTRFDPTAEAVGEAFATGVSLLAFGHIHRPARGAFGAGEYCILPAFDDRGVGLLADAEGVRYVRASADGLASHADPPPRDFPRRRKCR